DDLRHRLARTRWAERECVDDWSQGIPLDYTRELAAYWADGYDWRAREALLNRFDPSTTEIDGLDIHFIHQRSPHDDAFPLVITHGWPGSVVEFHKVIKPLNNAGFHVVCPSLPGYGFSGKPSRTGWGVAKVAEAWETLMTRLGYHRYGAQGGDWGGAVTTAIGRNGGHCAGIHLNFALAFPPADRRLRPGGFPGRPTGVDRREVLGVDGLRRASRKRADKRRAVGQRDDVLGYRVRRVVSANVLGELQRLDRRTARGPAHRNRRVPQRGASRAA